jgi:RNA recognition motif-containing protein
LKKRFAFHVSLYLQAFLEFDSIEHAQAMTDYFSSIPILLNGRQIFVQFSNHQELKTDPNNANNQQAQAALQSAALLQDIGQTGGQNCVLRVVINNMIYPINVDTLYQVKSLSNINSEIFCRLVDLQQIWRRPEDHHFHKKW